MLRILIIVLILAAACITGYLVVSVMQGQIF